MLIWVCKRKIPLWDTFEFLLWNNAVWWVDNSHSPLIIMFISISEQQPLKLNPAEISEVIAEVCSESSSPNVTQLSTPSRLNNHARQPSQDVAFSVLIKLVIDMYVQVNSMSFTTYILHTLTYWIIMFDKLFIQFDPACCINTSFLDCLHGTLLQKNDSTYWMLSDI